MTSKIIPISGDYNNVLYSNFPSDFECRTLECVEENKYTYIYLHTYTEKNNELKDDKKILLTIGRYNKTRIVVSNYLCYQQAIDYDLINALFSFLNIDWLLSPIKEETHLVRISYITAIILPILRINPFYTGWGEYILANKFGLNDVMNDYSELKPFLKDLFNSVGIDITLKEIMQLIYYSSQYHSVYADPTTCLFNILSRSASTHKAVSDLICRDVLKEHSFFLLFVDIYHMSIKLNKYINTSWSSKRLKQINTEWSWKIALNDIKKKSNTSLYNQKSIGEGILCNSEKSVFEEGLNMHHCVYTNYWRYVKDYNYIVIHYPSNIEKEGITIGLRVEYTKNKPIVSFDQAYYKYDKFLFSEDQLSVREYFTKHLEDFIKLIKDVRKN